jgi:hypothetical protein
MGFHAFRGVLGHFRRGHDIAPRGKLPYNARYRHRGREFKATDLFAPVYHFHNARQFPMKGHINALE